MQGALKLLPHPFGHQVAHFTGFGHSLHQLQGVGVNSKTLGREAGGKACGAQNAQGVFSEGFGNVTQQVVLKILLAAERVDNVAVFGLRHGIYGQVAAFQVFFQGYVGCAIHLEPVIAMALLSLSAGQRILFMGLGVQEHGKISAHLAKTLCQHGFRGGAHHHPVAVFNWQAEQLIAHGAANQVDVHKCAHIHDNEKSWRRLGHKPLSHKPLLVRLARRSFAVYAVRL